MTYVLRTTVSQAYAAVIGNIAVRAVDEASTVVEAVDPRMMVALTGNPELQVVSDDATTRLSAALASLNGSTVRAA